MTKKPPKISYRDLLAGSAGAARTPPSGAPAQAPPSHAGAPEVPPTPTAGSRDRLPAAPGSLNALAAALNAGRDVAAPALADPADELLPLSRRVTGVPLKERVRARSGTADLLLFRVGRERFALDLPLVEEAVELTNVHVVPESHAALLGVFRLRGQLTPIYSPARALGVELPRAVSALVMRCGEQRLAIAVEDVEDVLRLELGTVRDIPGVGDGDGILLGVARVERSLIALLDADALVAACRVDQELEIA